MINRDTAYRCVEAMAKAVSIPVSVKTRLGWEDHSHLIDFCRGLVDAGADFLTIHGRTYQQKFTGYADWTGIYELAEAVSVPVIGNGDVMSYDDGIAKQKNLAGFMIGRASFGNPWCFIPGGYRPTLGETIEVMDRHATLLIQTKGRKGCLEIRKHLVQYLHALPGARGYRKSLVTVESLEDVHAVLDTIRADFAGSLGEIAPNANESLMDAWKTYEG